MLRRINRRALLSTCNRKHFREKVLFLDLPAISCPVYKTQRKEKHITGECKEWIDGFFPLCGMLWDSWEEE